LRSLGAAQIEATGLPLAGAPRLQPKGIRFDDQGDLWIACEGDSLLIRFPASRRCKQVQAPVAPVQWGGGAIPHRGIAAPRGRRGAPSGAAYATPR